MEKFKSKKKLNRKRKRKKKKKKEEGLIENTHLHAREMGSEKQEKKIDLQMLSDHKSVHRISKIRWLPHLIANSNHDLISSLTVNLLHFAYFIG